MKSKIVNTIYSVFIIACNTITACCWLSTLMFWIQTMIWYQNTNIWWIVQITMTIALIWSAIVFYLTGKELYKLNFRS